MHLLERRLLAQAEARNLFPSPGLAVVAVSGGPDSVALLHALNELHERLGLEILVAHLDHGLRGEDAIADAASVGEIAGRLGLPAEFGFRPVARGPGLNLEEVAREARYAFLGEVAARRGARYLAVGHTADDQAETLLMRLLRGAGARGLTAMTPLASRPGVSIVRPLLEQPRSLVRSYLNDRKLSYTLDRTNQDLERQRNRVRQVLLPLIAAEFNPNVIATLGRTAAIMNELDAFVSRRAEGLFDSLLAPPGGELLGGGPMGGGAPREATSSEATSSEATSSEATSSEATSSEATSGEAPPGTTPPAGGDSVPAGSPAALIRLLDSNADPSRARLSLDLDRLLGLEPALQRYVLRHAVARLRHDLRGIGFGHIDALLDLARSGRRGRRVELPGGLVGLREGNVLALWSADPGFAPPVPLTPLTEEETPGEHLWPELPFGVRTRLVKPVESNADSWVNTGTGGRGENALRAVFDRVQLTPPVVLRSRRDGDRILLPDRTTPRKVKDLLIAAQVPRRLRPAVPILVDGAGLPEERVLWVAGVARSAHAASGAGTGARAAILLEVELFALPSNPLASRG
jgi:tRNA(Ile)-lysidine synthetase-like protein